MTRSFAFMIHSFSSVLLDFCGARTFELLTRLRFYDSQFRLLAPVSFALCYVDVFHERRFAKDWRFLRCALQQ